MEAWTSGRVSAAARQYWLKYGHYQRASMFEACRGGYRMYGWESEIDLCRAYGRGYRKSPHAYDTVPALYKGK